MDRTARSWDISCSHSMSSPSTLTVLAAATTSSLSQHASPQNNSGSLHMPTTSSSSLRTMVMTGLGADGSSRTKNICQPEVDIVDGIAFCAFENESQLNDFARQDENNKKLQNLNTVKRVASAAAGSSSSSNGGISGTANVSHLKASQHRPTQHDLLASIPPPPPLYKKPHTGGISIPPASSSTSTPKSSAFVSDILDRYLSQTKKELRGDSEHFGSPPEDSPIYCAGILKKVPDKQGGNPRKPFADLPLLSRGSSESSASASPSPLKRPRPRWPDISSPSEASVDDFEPQRQKRKYVKKQKITFAGDFKSENVTVVPDQMYAVTNLENCFTQFMQVTQELLRATKKTYHASFSMDSTYARYAIIDCLREPIKAIQAKASLDSSSPDKVDSPASSSESSQRSLDASEGGKGTIPKGKRGAKDADLATIISRHSKRDIRLPARYHQSGLIMGSQWVIPGLEFSPEKKGKKRLVDEQKRIQTLKMTADLPIAKRETYRELLQFHRKPGASDHRGKIIAIASVGKEGNSRVASLLDSKSGNVLVRAASASVASPHAVVATNISLQLHQQRMAKLKQANAALAGVSGSLGNEPRKGINRVIKYMPRPISNNNLIAASQKLTQAKNVSMFGSKTKKLSELKEAYRVLYMENDPKRRVHYANKGVKPRVNKKMAVEEGIEVIAKLNKKDTQLSHIKQCLTMWNHKLKQCLKVLETSSDEEKKFKVVQDVLKAYQGSFSYKVSEALDKKQEELKKTVANPVVNKQQGLPQQPPQQQQQQQQHQRRVQVVLPASSIRKPVRTPIFLKVPSAEFPSGIKVPTSIFLTPATGPQQVQAATSLLQKHQPVAINGSSILMTSQLQQTLAQTGTILRTAQGPVHLAPQGSLLLKNSNRFVVLTDPSSVANKQPTVKLVIR